MTPQTLGADAGDPAIGALYQQLMDAAEKGDGEAGATLWRSFGLN
jgi:hypothetical protein